MEWTILHNQPIELLDLATGKLTWPTLEGLRPEGINASLSVSGDPPIDARAIKAKCLDHYLGDFPGLNLQHRADPNLFESLVTDLSTVSLFHEWEV